MSNYHSFSRYQRKFFDADADDFTIIGNGSIGAKAKGLAFIKKHLLEKNEIKEFTDFVVNIPRLVVIATDFFDEFMVLNNLYDVVYSDDSDTYIAHKFQKAELPVNLVGDLRSIVSNLSTPLAVRSSSLFEDAVDEPFAGIYATKMISNNQLDEDTRFKRLIEAVKLVYASTFFKKAKDYMASVYKRPKDEKMAVIIQEVVGNRYGDKFYPMISGVARSYNFYTTGKSKPEEGVVNLALGLGKTIVDGSVSWTFSPAYPNVSPPFSSIRALMDNTQRKFWAVNMSKSCLYDPVSEEEYMVHTDINEAEIDGTLDLVCSTYDAGSDRIKPGISINGPRIINFNPILDLNIISLNPLIKKLLKVSEEALEAAVEIEFAVNISDDRKILPRFGFLQVRPMTVTNETVNIEEHEFTESLFNSNFVLGNGVVDFLDDVVFLKPEVFDIARSKDIALELESINKIMKTENRKYLLVGFGRWGSSDEWLGIPVEWAQISNAKVIIEAMLPNFNVELSQGSHFFHNINSFQVLYFSIKSDRVENIDWSWTLDSETKHELTFTKHIKLKKPLIIKVDGRIAKGVILK